MFTLLFIDHRLAFLALAALLIATAVPLGFAWARVLPEEPPPFPIQPGSFPTIDQESPPPEHATHRRDLVVSIALLICLTLAYLIRFPGFPTGVLIRWLETTVSGSTEHWIIFSIRIFLIASACAALGYAALRPGPLRIPLTTASALVLLLWFLAPLLRVALLSGS
jgi:hypothetical protein